MIAEQWPAVYASGKGVAYVNIGPNQRWPVAVGGEYLVLANPQLVKEAK
jgi:hypothetical protein